VQPALTLENKSWALVITSVILVTQEAEIRRIWGKKKKESWKTKLLVP
jgi:hypothetical protein